jgi:hypothetical protein
MIESNTVVNTYIACWNERDSDARQALVAATFTDDADYLDPLMSGRGVDEIAAMIGAAQQQFPDHEFSLSADPDIHSDRLRFSWRLALSGGPAVAGGTDFAVLAGDGRLQSVTGFLDPVD